MLLTTSLTQNTEVSKLVELSKFTENSSAKDRNREFISSISLSEQGRLFSEFPDINRHHQKVTPYLARIKQF